MKEILPLSAKVREEGRDTPVGHGIHDHVSSQVPLRLDPAAER